MRKVCFVNGSPRNKNSCSEYMMGVIKDMLDPNLERLGDFHIASCLKAGTQLDAFNIMAKTDVIIFVFPLYIDSIPSHMLDFLYQFEDYYKENRDAIKKADPYVYAVINNGFIEGHQNRNAARIIQHFACATGLNWRFAIGIGAGEFIKDTQKSIPLQSGTKKNIYDALLKLTKDIELAEPTREKNILASVSFSKTMFMFFANKSWIKSAKKNNISKKNIYSKPWEIK